MIPTGLPPPIGRPAVTLVAGTCFTISTTTGDMDPSDMHGLFYQDTRYLSGVRVLLDGHPPEPLSAQPQAPYEATFLSRRRIAGNVAPDGPRQVLLSRHRTIGDGLREDLWLRNLGSEDTICRLSLEFDTDFADMFSVKKGRPTRLGPVSWAAGGHSAEGTPGVVDAGSTTAGEPGEGVGPGEAAVLVADASNGERHRGVRISLQPYEPAPTAPGTTAEVVPAGRTLLITALVPGRGDWRATLRVHPVAEHEILRPDQPTGQSDTARVNRMRTLVRERAPVDLPADQLDAVLERSLQDLGALRIPLTDGSGEPAEAVAAGAPWFMTLFGRDSLLTSLMALPADPDLALSTLRVLAGMQGVAEDPLNEEQPGRILHEVRHGHFPLSPSGGASAGAARSSAKVYYGTVDATALFCMLVGELHRLGVPDESLRPLLPHVDRALDWILAYGDRDGDGFVEYRRSTDRGLFNQGWKDSGDSMVFGDGTQAEPPIALAEVQGYTYAAFLARTELARAFDDERVATAWAERAERLRQRFHEVFWLPDEGYFAMALDARKRPLDVPASNMGHCLWTGIVDPAIAEQVARRLLSPDLFSGWGIRTLASSAVAYDPASNHLGSVWPHDSALCAAGLARYGFAEEARQVAEGILAAAVAFGGRLPELFCGFPRKEFPYPVPYPTSCSPQAWAAAAPILLLRALVEPAAPPAAVPGADQRQ